MEYNFKALERAWQKRWEEDPYFATKSDKNSKKYYCLDMFPYPSGSGIHVGHWKGYVLSDVYSRIKWHQGYNVLHPMGWDAFGLPAENDAIKKGIHPKAGTAKNVENFRRQIKTMGSMYDWSKELDTTDPEYYKWTQWIFLQMFKAGLAYESMMPINWCPQCLTGLANEEASGGCCERCGTAVEQKNIRQWVLKITDYAEKLLEGLDRLDWPEKVKLMQKNWIGKSEGAYVTFKTDSGRDFKVFTTRPDTIHGVTFVVMAPDHDDVEAFIKPEHQEAVRAYQKEAAHKLERDKLVESKDKTGVFTGSYVLNPLTGAKIPVYLADYVLKNYGTGMVMGVPGNCERDFEFAQAFKEIAVIPVVMPALNPEQAVVNGAAVAGYEGEGALINSGEFDGLDALTTGYEVIVKKLESLGAAKRHTTYKLRDWIFSRQRYWGEPIPLVHCGKCGIVAVPESELPIKLPDVEKYQPTGTGESPLAAIDSWVNTSCPQCSGPAKRETNTMPQWAGSCWYFLRYPNPQNDKEIFSKEDMKYWLPVDLYIGGIEHAVLHLLYARFYVKVLHDQGFVPFDEPFKHLFNQGMVCMKSSVSGRVEKMSKSKGNVVNPDDVVEELGSDTLRLYMLFMGPPELDNEWQTEAVRGVKNYLNRLWVYLTNPANILPAGKKADQKTLKRFHLFLKNYQERLNDYKVNTAVSAAMEFLNDLTGNKAVLDREIVKEFLTAFSVMVPHFSSELLEKLLGVQLKDCVWPEFNSELASVDEVEIAIQINGKLRTTIVVTKTLSNDEVAQLATQAAKQWLEGKEVLKQIVVPQRLVSFVIK